MMVGTMKTKVVKIKTDFFLPSCTSKKLRQNNSVEVYRGSKSEGTRFG